MSTFLVGIAGGTASGKSYLASKLSDRATSGVLTILSLDDYYRELNHLPLASRASYNFDHPEAFDFPLLRYHLEELSRGNSVDVPRYDFSTHSRERHTKRVAPSPIMVVEGILALHDTALRNQFDYSVFIETAENTRLQRRLERDIRERGRTVESVHTQWNTTVAPGYLQFCAPTKRHADLILDGSSIDEMVISDLLASIESLAGFPVRAVVSL